METAFSEAIWPLARIRGALGGERIMRYVVRLIACCTFAALATVGAADASRAAMPLTPAQESALKPGESFDETAKQAHKDDDWMIADCRDGHVHTAPVGSYRPNAFGLFDMHGNVWEWVQDCSIGNYADLPTDGSAWTAGHCGYRVRRSGSWLSIPMRLAFRLLSGPVYCSDVGFRVARTLD
jgi:formylglycine-generating enzyme required for sulfatase activity